MPDLDEGPSSRDIADRAVERFLAGETTELRDMFDHRMKVAVSAEKIDDVRERAAKATGPYVRRGEPVAARFRGADLYDYPLKHQRGSNHLQVVVRDERVTGMLLRPGHPTGRWRRSKGLIRELLRSRRSGTAGS